MPAVMEGLRRTVGPSPTHDLRERQDGQNPRLKARLSGDLGTSGLREEITLPVRRAELAAPPIQEVENWASRTRRQLLRQGVPGSEPAQTSSADIASTHCC